MSDLISREALINKIKRNGEICPNVPWVTAYALALAEEAPAVNGKWVVLDAEEDSAFLKCSVCGMENLFSWEFKYGSNFCPSCGADMRTLGRD